MRIIVVDDREEERYLAETLLKGSGYEVVTAVNGAEALEKLRAEGFDMIVSDVLMPVMDGFRLCRECKGDEKLKDIPFIFYTATYKDERDEELASKVGAEKYIRKPIEPEEFVKSIKGVFRDVEEGKIGPKKRVLEEEKEVLKLYSERLIAKLEKMMLDLEAEIAQRKKAEERVKHLNLALKAIRSVNQLIVREKDRDRLLKGACNNLIKTRSYYNAWLVLLDKSGGLVTTAEAGLGKDFLPVLGQLRRGELPTCCQRALRQASVVAISDLLSTCGDCPLAKKHHGGGALTIRLEYDEKVYGLLATSVPVEFAADEEEQSLFQEVAGDIAFALHNIELEEERKRLEHSLKERVKELQCLYSIAKVAEKPKVTLDKLYQEVVNLLPQSWQYPEITCARITINDKEFRTTNYRDTEWKQSTDIEVHEAKAGTVDVGYLEARPELDKGPFLKEERRLIDAVAKRLGNITEHKQAEEQLRIAEQNFRNSLDSSPLGIRIVTSEGELLYANQAILDIYGYSSVKELKATPAKKRYTPESYAEHQERVRRRKLGKPVPSSYEVSTVRKDGEVRHLIASRKAVVWSGEVQFQTIYQDITERKRAEKQIRSAAEEWSTTFDSINDLVFICDKDFRLTRVNKAFADLLKKKPAELIGKHCYEVFHGTNEPIPRCPHEKTIQTKKPATADFFEPLLGIHLEVATSPIFNEEGEVVASVHVARDITERKKMEEQLIVTDRLASIGELASGIAHELNNPLTSVIGFSDLLLDRDVPDDIKKDLSIINKEAKRTAGIVRNLLTFARRHPEEKELININGIIEKVLEPRTYEQKVNNIEVNTQFAPDLPEIIADGFQLQQVFTNIIINAEHFMIEAHGRGNLTITTERIGDVIRASFADDGPGIAKENLGHLFDPFFTTKEVGKGTGLGLSICHGIVTAHDGRIYTESKLGKGATFVVELPLTTSDKGGTKNENS